MKLTYEELQKLIKEEVDKLHRQTLIENRIEQINQELNALSNPSAWEDAHKEAQNQLRKKTIAFNNMIPREKLMNENNLEEKKYSDAASDFIGDEISHLMHDKDYEHDRAVAAAINIAKDKGYKIPKPANEVEKPKRPMIQQEPNPSDDDKEYWARVPKERPAKPMIKKEKNPELNEKVKEDIADIMKRANKLMSEARTKMKK